MRQKAGAHTSFTARDVEGIRAARDRGEDARDVADLYGVAPSTIRKIWRGETFRHVGVPGAGTVERGGAATGRVLTNEPSEEELEESKRKFAEMMRAEGMGDKLVGELKMDETPDDPGVGGD